MTYKSNSDSSVNSMPHSSVSMQDMAQEPGRQSTGRHQGIGTHANGFSSRIHAEHEVMNSLSKAAAW